MYKLFILFFALPSFVYCQFDGNKIKELKAINSVEIGNLGEEIEGAYDIFTYKNIDLKTISGKYSDIGGGDFSVEYNIKIVGGKLQISLKEEGIDIRGKVKTSIQNLAILSIDRNRIKTNHGLFIYSNYNQNDLVDANEKKIKAGFLIIEKKHNTTNAFFIWKQ